MMSMNGLFAWLIAIASRILDVVIDVGYYSSSLVNRVTMDHVSQEK